MAIPDEEDSQQPDTGGVIIPRPQPEDHAAVARAHTVEGSNLSGMMSVLRLTWMLCHGQKPLATWRWSQTQDFARHGKYIMDDKTND